MRVVNLIIVMNKEGNQVLMCLRQKPPYKGFYNFVGGKVEDGEDHLEAAYRELEEETNITKHDITIEPLFFTNYFKDNVELQVYYGQLKHEVSIKKEINPLVWIDFDSDFLDGRFAGDGNIEHMIACIRENVHATW